MNVTSGSLGTNFFLDITESTEGLKSISQDILTVIFAQVMDLASIGVIRQVCKEWKK